MMNRITLLILTCTFVSYFSFAQSTQKNTLEKVIHLKNDSLKNAKLLSIIYQSYVNKDWKTFNNARGVHLTFSKQRKDSLSYAYTMELSGSYFQIYAERPDSAFYYFTKGKLIYKALKDSSGVGRVLVNNAILRKNIHDYTGSIATSFDALKYIDQNQTRTIASVYNNLGISFNQRKDTADAIKYHLKSLALREDITDFPYLKLQSLNNLGKVYKDIANYPKAIKLLYPFIRDSSIYRKYPKDFAMILDNYGHAIFLHGQQQEGANAMKKSLRIREHISHKDGIVINKIHLAEYYLWKKDTLKAISLIKSANKLAKEILNYRDYLVSMKFLADLYKGDDSKRLYQKYDHIKDSLALADKRHEDLFNQYEYELDEKEHELLSKEKALTLNRYILIGFGIVVLLVLLIILIHRQKQAKAKRLQMEVFKKGFQTYLKNKYKLTSQNLEFWEAWLLDIKPEELAEELFITIDAVKSRRRSLRDKIYKVQKIEGNFTQARAIRIYNQELDDFKKHS